MLVAAADVCNLEEMRAAVAAATERFGGIDAVIHAAGVIDDGPLLAKSPGRDRGRALAEGPRHQGARRAVPRRQPRLAGALLLDQHDHGAGRAGRLRRRQRVPERLRQEPPRRPDAGRRHRLGHLERGRHGRDRAGRAHWATRRRPRASRPRRRSSTPRASTTTGHRIFESRLIRGQPLGARRAPHPVRRRAAAGHRLPRAGRGGAAGARRDRRLRDPRPATSCGR